MSYALLIETCVPKTIEFPEETDVMETGEALQLKEVKEASSRFKACPKCRSIGGFWVGIKRERADVQCKTCGASKMRLFLTIVRYMILLLGHGRMNSPKRFG
jgi:hypothetical protein